MSKEVERYESYFFNNITSCPSKTHIENFEKRACLQYEFWGYEEDGNIIVHRPPEEGPAFIRYMERTEDLVGPRGKYAPYQDQIFKRKGKDRFAREKIWYQHGKKSRPPEQGPAIVRFNELDTKQQELYGSRFSKLEIWSGENRNHREDGPAVVGSMGDFVWKEEYYQNGRLFRENDRPTRIKRTYNLTASQLDICRDWDKSLEDHPMFAEEDHIEEIPQKYKEEERIEIWSLGSFRSHHRVDGPAWKKFLDDELEDKQYYIAGKDREYWKDLENNRDEYVNTIDEAFLKIEKNLEDYPEKIEEAKRFVLKWNM
jgi:hypothetical protein